MSVDYPMCARCGMALSITPDSGDYTTGDTRRFCAVCIPIVEALYIEWSAEHPDFFVAAGEAGGQK